MKLAYSVLKEIEENPENVQAAQRLTLDRLRPQGLNGTYGLYGSTAWVENLLSGAIPTEIVLGTIKSAYKAGMYESHENNTVEISTPTGEIFHKGIYVNNPLDAALFKPGAAIEMILFIEDLKSIEPTTGEHRKHHFMYKVFVGV